MVFWGFFPEHGPLHFIILLTPCILHFIEMTKKKGKESQFVPAADIDPKVSVSHKIIPVRPIRRKNIMNFG